MQWEGSAFLPIHPLCGVGSLPDGAVMDGVPGAVSIGHPACSTAVSRGLLHTYLGMKVTEQILPGAL